MQANSRHRKLLHIELSFRIWKMWKDRAKLTKI